MATFEEQLAVGRLAESAIVRWLRSKGNSVITVYEIEHKNGLGPRFLGSTKAYVAPDVLVFKGNGKVLWCETKHKTVFSWYRIGRCWETGIDAHHFADYRRVAEETGLPVWLVFLHTSDQPSAGDIRYGCPPRCPVGLFGGELGFLADNISHDSSRWGRHGMVYWAHDTLKLLAPLADVQREAA